MNEPTITPSGEARRSVLLVDDEPFSEAIVRLGLVADPACALRFTRDPEAAVALAGEVAATVVFVDLSMPGVDGLEIIRRLRADSNVGDVSIIVLTTYDDPNRKVRAFAAGANDYLVKWPDPRELMARVGYHSDVCLARRERDAAFSSLRDSQGRLAASQSALLQAQKMEAIDQLAGGVAHDFINVLQIIAGNLQLLKLAVRVDAAAGKRIDLALDDVRRGTRLAAQLLAFARRQPLQAEVVNPGHLLRDMDDQIRSVIGSRARVITDVAPGLGNVFVDPDQFHHVLLNVVLNARDAMTGGGTLTIFAGNACTEAGDYVSIEVADTGSGMTPEVMARAFEPFFTTKATGEGTGLGLAVAYGFVKQAGGDIVLSSSPGEGTRVRISLPRTDMRILAKTVAQVPASPGTSRTILVVEDDADMRMTTCGLLQFLGYRVIEAPDAGAAISIITRGEEVDLVFSDVAMPGPVNCLQLTAIVRAHRPHVPILFTSGYAARALEHEGGLDSRVDLLQKPYEPDALAVRLRELLERSR